MDLKIALIPIVAMFVPVILVPVILGLRHAKIERQLEHAERMKALELGRTLPKDEPWWSPQRISLAFGVVMPIGVFFFAWMAASDHQTSASPIPIWLSSGIVGLAGVLSGAVIACRQIDQSSADHSGRSYAANKPEMDADYFDVVGRRG